MTDAAQIGQSPHCKQWGNSSVGRALHSHCRGREFDSPLLHHSVWPVRPFCIYPLLLSRLRGYFATTGSGRADFRSLIGLFGLEFSVSDCVRPASVYVAELFKITLRNVIDARRARFILIPPITSPYARTSSYS